MTATDLYPKYESAMSAELKASFDKAKFSNVVVYDNDETLMALLVGCTADDEESAVANIISQLEYHEVLGRIRGRLGEFRIGTFSGMYFSYIMVTADVYHEQTCSLPMVKL